MNRLYFAILIEILVLVVVFSAHKSESILSAYENSISSKIQANLLTLRLIEARHPEILEATQTKNKDDISLLFVGDIMLSRGVANQIEKYSDPNYPFLKIADTIESADFSFANLENPVSSQGENQGSVYSLRANPESVAGLKFAGFDGLFLANNHILDWGRIALEDTIDLLEKGGISPVGVGRNEAEANSPLVINFRNTKIAFLSYTTLYPKSLWAKGDESGISSFDMIRIRNEIEKLKSSGAAHIVVVSFHWGDEYEDHSNSEQKRIARSLIDAGADLIVGHHPHVIQEIERYRNGWIAYSLGNFVFDQNFSADTKRGLILKAMIQNKKISTLESQYVEINSTFQPEALAL